MKVATGNYFNLFSEAGHDNCNLRLKFDIMVIFIESFTLTADIVDSLTLLIEGRLTDIGLNHPFARKDEIQAAVIQVLEALGYEYERVLVEQRIA